MSKITPVQRYRLFKGINNIDESYRFPLGEDVIGVHRPTYYVKNAENLDIDNSQMLVDRQGYDKKVTGVDAHSLWSSDDLAFFADSGVFYQLHTNYTTTELYSPIVGRISYARFNDRIYFSDGAYIGHFKNGAVSAIQDPNMAYKAPLPAGKLMVHGAKLHVAKGKVLYIGDELKDCYDTRHGYRVFNNDIQMMISLKKGFYISDSKTWWVSGIVPEEYVLDDVFDVPAIPGTEVPINGSAFDKDGDYAMWVTSEGICLGDSSGKALNLTKGRYSLNSHGLGAAMVRNVNNVTHFIASLE